LDAEADDYLVKPFAARELLARVTNQITLRRLRTEARQAVTDSELRFRTALSASRVGFAVLQAVRDADERITDFQGHYLNQSAERLIGRPGHALIGQQVGKLLPWAWQAPQLFATIRRVVDSGNAADVEVPLSHTGSTRWFHYSIARMGDGVVIWFA